MVSFDEADVWHPTPELVVGSNLATLIRRMNLSGYDEFLRVSVAEPELYWGETLRHLGIVFDPPARAFLDQDQGKAWARFFPDAGFNVAQWCLRPPSSPDGMREPAVIGEDERGVAKLITYEELGVRTRSFAAGLLSLGVVRGDRVGLLFPSSPEAVITLLAICYVGAIVVPLYSGFGSDAVARRLADSGATVLIAADGFHRKGRRVPLGLVAAEAVLATPGCRLVIALDPESQVPAVPHSRWEDVAAFGAEVAPAQTLATDPCMILYTSGTSGKPKGAIHRHAGFPLRVAQDTAFLFDFRVGDRFFWPSDMGWMVGPYATFASLLLKGALVLYSGSPDRPNLGRLRAVAVRSRVTHFGTTPTAIRSMAAAEDDVLLGEAPDLRVLMTGGEAMDEDAHAWLFHRFGAGRLPIINYSGGTECSGAILSNVVLRPIVPGRFNSTAPGVAGRVVDDNGTPVKAVPGELAISQPFNGMTAGFWNDDARYLETYWSRVPGMWVHGDLALEEPLGQYLILGRSDDVMKISGRRVGPSEIEGSIVDGKCVADAVAFSVPDTKTGEAMIVCVVPGPDARSGEDSSLADYVGNALQQKMGASFRAHAIVTLPALIKTRNGKLVRRLVRQAWLGQPPGDLTAIDNPAVFEQVVAQCASYRQSARDAAAAPALTASAARNNTRKNQ
jgi:acetyl-CoA synthetase